MKYSIPLILDSQNEPTGFFTLFTTLGPVVFIFSNQLKLKEFMDAAYAMAAKHGEKVGFAEKDAASMSEVVSQILAMNLSLAENVTFLPDSDPIIDDFIAQMKDLSQSIESPHPKRRRR